MNIVIIGSGNVATHLSLALKSAGENIIFIYSRSSANASTLAESIGCKHSDNLNDIPKNADAYIFSIKDDVLPSLAKQLDALLPQQNRSRQTFIHTAGSVPLSVFPEGRSSAVLYPMQTFSKSRKVNFREVPCFIEASDVEAMMTVAMLAEGISDLVEEVDSDARKKLHLAAVFACNLTNHCYRLAERILEEEGIDFSLYHSLILETARKATEMSPKDAQTGPMVRQDNTIMNAQMALIHDDTTREIYHLMAKSIKEIP